MPAVNRRPEGLTMSAIAFDMAEWTRYPSLSQGVAKRSPKGGGMKHQEGTFTGTGGAEIYHQCWLPDDHPNAVLVVAHGLAEHSGRYMNLVSHFVPLNIAVYALDHIGHGKSDGRRVFVERFQDYIEPLDTLVDMARDQHPDLPLFLVGHSMGGLIAAVYLLDFQHKLRGAVLSGPGVKVPDDISRATIMAGKFFSRILPKLGIIALEADAVSRDPAVVKAYLDDPLVYNGKVTARLGAEMLKTMEQLALVSFMITLPVLIVQGGADRLVDPAGARTFHDRIGSKDKTLTIYDGLYHEVFNEPEHPRVLADVQAWIEARLGDHAG